MSEESDSKGLIAQVRQWAEENPVAVIAVIALIAAALFVAFKKEKVKTIIHHKPAAPKAPAPKPEAPASPES